jgi:MFS family permease
MMAVSRLRFLFLNLGHFITHFLMLVFATVAALRLGDEWGMTYAELLPYATPGFIAYGLLAVPAGWLADRWSREGMMALFFLGIGLSAMYTASANSVPGIALGLTLIGGFAAIYHPVGLALVIQGRRKMGVPLAINGVFGNLGVAFAALVSGYLIELHGWRSAFLLPGAITVVVGLLYVALERKNLRHGSQADIQQGSTRGTASLPRSLLRRIFIVILLTTALGGLIFQSTTYSLPKVFAERLVGLASGATEIGAYAALVFTIAALAQLVVGFLVDQYSLRKVFLCVALLQAVLFAVMIGLTGWPALLVSIGFMFAVFGEIPISDVLIGRVASGEWRSRAFALNYLVGFGVSASSLPLIAWIYAGWGFGALFGVLALTALLIACVVLYLPQTRVSPKDENYKLAD